jgi:hypothetical protein
VRVVRDLASPPTTVSIVSFSDNASYILHTVVQYVPDWVFFVMLKIELNIHLSHVTC